MDDKQKQNTQGAQYTRTGASGAEDLNRELERQVRDAVGALAQAVQSTVVSVADSVRQGVETAQPHVQRALEEARRQAEMAAQQAQANAAQTRERTRQRDRKLKEREKRSPQRFGKKAAEAAGAAGGMGLVAGIMTAVTIASVTEADFAAGDWTGSLILAVIAGWFLFGAISSALKARKLRRLSVYMNQLGERTNVTVGQMAQAADKSEGYVRRDLKKMLASGMLDSAYLAPDGTRLFSSELACRLYTAQQDAPTAAAKQAAKQPPEQKAQPAAEPQPVSGVLESCRGFAEKLAQKSECIDDPGVTTQVDELTEHTKRIMAWLEKHPEQEGRIKRFAGYYLPTTLKLLETYDELEPHAVPGSVAAESMREIAQILGTINKAFQTLENGLVQDTAMDISAEISAMETMMAQEGLTENEMHVPQ